MTTRKIIIAGFGGQGVMAMGQIISFAGMAEDKQVSWYPSYGPEMRGGSANCSVTISDEKIGAPNISMATDVIAMNGPSYDKFKHNVLPGGNLFINSSLCEVTDIPEGIHVYQLPVSQAANDLEAPKVANMVMLGSFLEVTGIVSQESTLDATLKVFGDNKKKLIPLENAALNKGRGLVHGEKVESKDVEETKTPLAFGEKEATEAISLELPKLDDSVFVDDVTMAKWALKSENASVKLYEALAKRFRNTQSEILFESLAKQEREHVEYVKAVYFYLKGEEDAEVARVPKPPTKDWAWGRVEEELSMNLSPLALAMGMEQETIKFYKKASELAEDEIAKELFSDLIFWEEFQYQQLKGPYDQIQAKWFADMGFSRM